VENTKFLKMAILNKITPYIIVFLAAFAIYAQTVNFGFVNDDDYKLAVSSSQNYSQPCSVINAFQNDVFYGNMTVYFYRPLLAVSFIADNKIAGTSVFQAHLTNVLLHGICAALVLFFCRKYLFGHSVSLLAALLFAVHPATIQTVAWIAGRNDSILFMFFILCLIFFKEYLTSKKFVFLGLHFIFLIFCLYTKEHALAIPFLLFCFYILTEEKKFKLPLGVYFLWFLALAVFLASKRIVIPDQTGGLSLSFSKQIFAVFFDHISAIIFFRAPMAEHPETKIFVLGIASCALILFFGAYKKSFAQIKQNLFYIAAAAAFLLPDFIIGAAFAGRTTFQGNRLYIPLFCIAVIFFSFCKTVMQINFKLKKPFYIFIAALIVLSSYITIVNSRAYKDDLTFWTRVVSEGKMIKLLPVLYHINALTNHGLYEEALKEALLYAQLTEYKNTAVLKSLVNIYKILGDDKKADYYISAIQRLYEERSIGMR